MTFVDDRFDRVFARVVRALEPYLADVVFVGGVASALYRHHPHASPSSLRPILTTDVDLACAGHLPRGDREPIAVLLPRVDLEIKAVLATTPPLTKFVERGTDSPVEVEFLTPLIGPCEIAALAVQPSLVAEPLRYLDLLLVDSWTASWADVPGLEALAACAPGRIPHPCAYVLQKALIRSRRSGARAQARRRKDSYYMYEIGVLFRDRLDRFSEWCEANRAAIHVKWLGDALSGLTASFLSDDAVGAREAAEEYAAATGDARTVTPARVQETLRRLIEAIARGGAGTRR